MTITTNFHTHTKYCDGIDTPEEMVLTAIEKGFTSLGFSGHSPTWFDKDYAMTPETAAEYREEINALKEKYDGRIKIFCGVEQDYWSEESTKPYDYAIGSVHYVKKDGEFIPVDLDAETQLEAVDKLYGGDYMSFAEDYYRTEEDVVRRTDCSIIGHIDLITKFNEGGAVFDEKNPRYVNAWKKAVNALIPYGVPFEINTNAMAKGYRTEPYPSMDILNYIHDNGGRICFSSDTHDRRLLGYMFDESEKRAKAAGFSSHWIITSDGLKEVPL